MSKKIQKKIGHGEGGGKLGSLSSVLNGIANDLSRVFTDAGINLALQEIKPSTEDKIGVTVTVLDSSASDAEPVEGASVELAVLDGTQETVTSGTTDSDGEVVLYVFAGDYYINTTATGFDDEDAVAASTVSASAKTFTVQMTETVS